MLPFKNNELIQRFQHQPIMVDEVLNALQPRPDGIYLDGTMGGAGHSRAILEAAKPSGKLIALDRDEIAVEVGRERLAIYGERVCVLRRNFSEIQEIAAEYAPQGLDGILLDIGVSSPQLDDPARGFSYMQDGPLDMRMDQRQRMSAQLILNTYTVEELTDIFYRYGEEKWAKRIAEFVIAARRELPIVSTFQLVDIIKKAVPKGAREKDQHPAKRVFQALRIEVNGELKELEGAIDGAVAALKSGGRLAIITFHSLEDRIVKSRFRYLASDCICPLSQPTCTCNKKAELHIITKKPLLPSEAEVAQNPRARSAKLRVAEKL